MATGTPRRPAFDLTAHAATGDASPPKVHLGQPGVGASNPAVLTGDPEDGVVRLRHLENLGGLRLQPVPNEGLPSEGLQRPSLVSLGPTARRPHESKPG